MGLGVIVRADQGGLAAQSQLIADVVGPDRVVVVDMGPHGRGTQTLPGRLPDGWMVAEHRADSSRETARRVAHHFEGCSTVWTAESWYWPNLPRFMGGTRMCVHANPELFRPDGRNEVPALPTDWHAAQLGYPVVPHPTPWGRPGWADVREGNLARGGPARRVLHVAAPAMLDRNGTRALVDGLAAYDGEPFRLVVAGSGLDTPTRGRPDTNLGLPKLTGTRRQVTVERIEPVADRVGLYADVDLLVLPRRYAGLCLVAQEAAAAGVPVLMSELEPQVGWAGVDASIRCGRGEVARMRAGRFRVAAPDPGSVCERVSAFTGDDGRLRGVWQGRAVDWAQDGRWGMVADRWDDWLQVSR